MRGKKETTAWIAFLFGFDLNDWILIISGGDIRNQDEPSSSCCPKGENGCKLKGTPFTGS